MNKLATGFENSINHQQATEKYKSSANFKFGELFHCEWLNIGQCQKMQKIRIIQFEI